MDGSASINFHVDEEFIVNYSLRSDVPVVFAKFRRKYHMVNENGIHQTAKKSGNEGAYAHRAGSGGAGQTEGHGSTKRSAIQNDDGRPVNKGGNGKGNADTKSGDGWINIDSEDQRSEYA